MSERKFARFCVAWAAWLVLGTNLAAAGQASGDVTGPFVLVEPLSIISEIDSTEAADDASAAEATASDDESASSQFVPPVIESKPLGRANSVFGARPRETSASSDRSSGLAWIDPRSNEVTRVLSALAAVVGLILLARTLMRRASGLLAAGGRPSGVLEILARYPIGRGQQLMLLKCARRVVLLHQSGSTMTALSEISEPNEVAALLSRMEAGAGERDGARFRKTFNEFMAEHESAHDGTRPARTEWPLSNAGEAEIVDLTRRSSRGLSQFFNWRGAK